MSNPLRLALASFFILVSTAIPASAKNFIDYGPAPSFLDLDIHALFGGAMITENYLGSFPEITQMNTSPGSTWGAGAKAVFGIRDWVGLGTGIDLVFNHYRVDMAVAASDVSSVSNIFLRNSSTYIRIPVFLQVRFNVSSNVRWVIDGGMYYAYGIGGSQSQDIYNAQVNSLGQLVSTVISAKNDYFSDDKTFIHSNRRSDIGLHLASGLRFSRLSIGAGLDFGLKNIAYIPHGRGIVTPNIHNFCYYLSVGYAL
ncbi:MAG: PorT family protein [Pseudoflavonifractor sp.]|nr:PorT family protein [Alloprevotella sp.]MCM1116018.1 PorT family protein [Pseudoflavonifractor sp.]